MNPTAPIERALLSLSFSNHREKIILDPLLYDSVFSILHYGYFCQSIAIQPILSNRCIKLQHRGRYTLFTH